MSITQVCSVPSRIDANSSISVEFHILFIPIWAKLLLPLGNILSCRFWCSVIPYITLIIKDAYNNGSAYE